ADLNLPAAATSRRSALLGDIGWHGARGLASFASIEWDSENNRIEQGAFNLRLRRPAQAGRGLSIANLGYRYRKRDSAQILLAKNIEQVDASVVTALNSSWGLFGRYQYDLNDERSAETLAGLQYDDCCLQLRLVYRDGLIYDPGAAASGTGAAAQRDRTVYLQLEFKGLAGVGRALENVLEESIFGYRAN
ncbi:MAG: LPS assembly protein LptD, partial [Pseudomonadales bacterium]|nr:LPS assembly protein LptD [Pseudomonadales bacterium]